jgi:hypothetical protein
MVFTIQYTDIYIINIIWLIDNVINLNFRIDRLSCDVSPQMRIVVGSSGGRFATNTTGIRFNTGVSLEMVRQIIVAGESLVALGTLETTNTTVLRHVPLPIGLVRELEATLVAHERLHTTMRPHMGLQKALP